MRLTRAIVSRFALPPGKREAMLYDDDVSGFGLRVHPGGRRTWFVQYRLGTKQGRLTLGTADAVDPEDARKRAKAALAKVALGIDPQGERQAARDQAALTVKAVVPRYLRFAEGRQRAGHHDDVRRYLLHHWAPLGGRPVNHVTRADVAERLGEIASKSGPYAANRARAALSAFFAWGMGEGIADANPVIGTHKATLEIARDRVLTDAELVGIWHHAAPDDFRDAVRLLILTGQRREEVGAMRWSEIRGTVWTIAAERSKNGKPHDVPLSPQALAILEARSRVPGRDLVLGTGTGGYQGWSHSKLRLDAAMRTAPGLDMEALPWRVHDIRRTAATRMADLGALPHVIEAVLNHISGHKAGVAGIYNRSSYAAEKRAALDLWGSHVAALVGGKVENDNAR